MNAKLKRVLLLASFAFPLMVISQPAAAQWSASAVGVAEYDTEEALLLLAGVSAGPGGLGWRPLVGVQAYHLSYKLPTETKRVFSVRPYAGVRNNFTGGSLAFTAGYAFVSDDEAPRPLGTAVADSKDGVVVSGALDHWGTGGPLGYQVLASYNFGGQSLWTRGRVTTRVRELASGGQVRVGGEVAYASSDNFSLIQPGVVAEWHNGTGFILGFGVGRKLVKDGDDATFFRVETVLPLMR